MSIYYKCKSHGAIGFLILIMEFYYSLAHDQGDEYLMFVSKRQKLHIFSSGTQAVETLSWVVKLRTNNVFSYTREELDTIADSIEKDTTLQNLGQVGELQGHYLFASSLHKSVSKFASFVSQYKMRFGTVFMERSHVNVSQGNLSDSNWDQLKLRSTMLLDRHPSVDWYVQQLVRTRTKRDFMNTFDGNSESGGFFINSALYSKTRKLRDIDSLNPPHFNDPFFPKQWHLVNTWYPGRDINITGVWLHNITGRGVTIAVVDDGLEWKNPDLLPNYNSEGSFDLNSNDKDPSPSLSKETNHHGTRCAGEIAAVANNKVCGVGVAYQAQISGIRILDGPMTDDLEAVAFTQKLDVNSIYSCSWGPEDDGKTVDGPQHLAIAAMRHGVDHGRQGYGVIYVVASGNGGRADDNCNYDGYANSIYTVTVGAIDEDGNMPYYGEACASMLAVTYSSGGGRNGYERNIVTTDWTQYGGTGCTESHTGTSAAAPIASALIGLMLEARPCLTWRDVQYIITVTAIKVDVEKAEWVQNAAGLYHSHEHGFGQMNAWRLVNTAKIWRSIPFLTLFTSEEIQANLEIPPSESLLSKFNVTSDMLEAYNLNTLEYVHVKLTLSHQRRGDVSIILICPSTTSSIIGATRKLDESKDGFRDWTFSTVRCWGESPVGVWTLQITDKGAKESQSRGYLIKWQLQLYGSPMTSDEVAERIRLVSEALSGKYLNSSFHLPCLPPPVHTEHIEPISERLLKILLLTAIFLVFIALYETLEYMFCYNEEKKEHSELLQLTENERHLNCRQLSSDEATHLLNAEEIEMDNLVIAENLRHVAVDNTEQHSGPDLLVALDEVLIKEGISTTAQSSTDLWLDENDTERLLTELSKELVTNDMNLDELGA